MKPRYDLRAGITLASLVLLCTGCRQGQTPGATLAPEPTSASAPETATNLTSTSAATSTPEATAAPTLAAGEQAHMLAETGVTANADWTPYTEEIDGVKMALVPAGCFLMGSTEEQIADAIELANGYLDNMFIESQGAETSVDPAWFDQEKPAHMVCFEKPFWIDVTEVTNSQFVTFGGEAGREGQWSDADRPRDTVNWIESDAFCRKRGARLLTEAEWEYAARGPDGLIFPWGNTWDESLLVWNPKADPFGVPNVEDQPVGSKPGGVSWVGAYDMIGNVAEWVSDWASMTYYATQEDGVINPQGPEEEVWQTVGSTLSGVMRSMRGGEWYMSDPIGLRSAFRGGYMPDGFSSHVGLRCARSYEP